MRLARSITFRVAVFSAVVFAVIATVTGVIGVRLLHSELITELDRGNLNRVTDLAGQVEFGTSLPEIVPLTDDSGAALLDEDGVVVAATDDFGDARLLDLYLDNLDDEGFDVGFDIDQLEGSESMRGVVTSAYDEANDTIYAIFVATSTDDVDATVDFVTRSLVIAIPFLTLVVGGLVYLMARRSLRSVELLRREVESFEGTDLERRLPEPAVDDELGRLAHTMNGMLDRVEQSSERQRRFAADASHELRSPLASMVAQLDVDLAHPDRADWQETARSLQAETTRMQRLVDDLLLLARRGAHDTATIHTSVAIDDVVLDATAVRPPDGIELRVGSLARMTMAIDGAALRRVLDNLIANALRHAEHTVHVATEQRVTGGSPMLAITVDDDGAGIDPADRERVFDRFVRLDEARSRDAGGSGLGLAICRELVVQLGGSIHVVGSPLGGARFDVVLPAEPASTDPHRETEPITKP